ncbi:MAG: DUF5011 domain-containing protein [Oscillospiraceae bacterium]|nr:DUF5011 domain-containing protein [Oscillospiraceae bacterium]
MESYKRRKKRKKTGFVVSVVIILLIITGMFLLAGSESGKIKDNITIEAGASVPDISEFFINPKTSGFFITDITLIDTSKISSIEIEMEIGRKRFTSVLTIEDTIPPTGKPVELYIFENCEIKADELVNDIDDATQVTCSFDSDSEPDLTKPGRQDVTVILTDEGNNKTEIKSELYIFDVIDKLEVEAGTDINLKAEDFIDNYIENSELFFKQNEKIDFLSPGDYSVTLELQNYTAQSVVKIVDTIPPTGEPVELYIFKYSEINPEDLVKNIQDVTQVTCSFKTEPDLTKPGWQSVKVILTDEGDNKTEIKSRIYIFDVIDELVIEYGNVKNLTAKDFIPNYTENKDLYLIINQKNDIGLLGPGAYPVKFELNNYTAESVLKIQDTTPPKASVKNCRTYKNKPVPATDFVYNIRDFSPVTVKYKTQPDFSVPGSQNAYIVLEDAYGNITEYIAQLTIIEDTTPPVISGDLNKSVVVGGTIAYRAGITVTDDYDPNVQLVVDSSQVNLNKAGTYTVIYSAKDESGNKTEIKGTITVMAIEMALVNEMADDILSKITDGSMSKYDKAKAIFYWVHGKMKYSASVSPREIAQAAYNCFTKGSGDCYTYMAASQVLLTRAGIQNQMAQRIPEAATQHYWNIINTGGGWYHFDVCPTPGDAVTVNQRFMFTESQAKKYTQTITGKGHYYDYDKSTVPEVTE